MMENWCPCRARFVTASVRRALNLPSDERHYMILTTNHPCTNEEFAVGFLEFSTSGYSRVTARLPNRWDENKYLPYVGSRQSKLVSFRDAFPLRPWMNQNGKSYLPGKRCGIVNGDAYPDLLERIIDHFSNADNQIDKFLANVQYLEGILKGKSSTEWKNYSDGKRGNSYNSSQCSYDVIRKARC